MRILVLIPASRFSKNVPRDLIYGCWCKGRRIGGIKFPPLPQMLLATMLRGEGFDTALIDAGAYPGGMEGIDGVIGSFDFLIMLSSTMSSGEDAAALSSFKKINPNLKTLIMGAHATFMPEETLSMEGVDFIAMREAEAAIIDLLKAYSSGSWRDVQGIGWKDEQGLHVNGPHPFIENLDELPIADRTLLGGKSDYFNPIVKRIPYTTMITSRGCPGRCIYCSSPPFYGKKYRLQSAERVLKEIEYLAGLGYKEIFFRDETFTASKKRVREICEGILERKLNISWICSTRADTADFEIMTLMKKAGCHMLRVGVETGVQGLLDNIKKGITIVQTEAFFKSARRAGLDTHAHCMLGVPGETKDTIEQTIKFVKKIEPTIVTFGICTPYPGTELFEMVKKERPEIGSAARCSLENLHTDAFYNQFFTDLEPAYLAASLRRAYRAFYLRPSYIFKWLRKIDSVDEFRRVTLAASEVFRFIGLGD